MTSPRAPQNSAVMTAGLPALLLYVCCASASAATDIGTPCPSADNNRHDKLHDMLVHEQVIAPVSDIESEVLEESDEKVATEGKDEPSDAQKPEYTTRLPGVSAHDMPRFRRHMFRTDI